MVVGGVMVGVERERCGEGVGLGLVCPRVTRGLWAGLVGAS